MFARWVGPLLVAACGRVDAAPPTQGTTALTPPATSGSIALERALAGRRSSRAFGAPIAPGELSQLLWAAQGVTEPATGKRTAPSAGALYPLDVYVARADGIFLYRPDKHALDKLGAADKRAAIAKASLDQEAVRAAPTLIVLTGTAARLRPKYLERSERYMFLEAGHAAQNLLLQAHALGIAAVPIGAFDDEAVRAAIAAPPGATPLYVIPVAHTP